MGIAVQQFQLRCLLRKLLPQLFSNALNKRILQLVSHHQKNLLTALLAMQFHEFYPATPMGENVISQLVMRISRGLQRHSDFIAQQGIKPL